MGQTQNDIKKNEVQQAIDDVENRQSEEDRQDEPT
jgi:hypothetical protein